MKYMKKTKMLVALIVLMLAVIIGPRIYAASVLNYEKLSYGNAAYKILVDGQTFTIPDYVTYDDGYSLNLSTYKTRVSQMNVNALTYRNNGELTYNGGLYNALINDEYVIFFNEQGGMNQGLTDRKVKDGFEKYQILPNRRIKKQTYEEKIANENPSGSVLEQYNFRISTYAEDIALLEKIQTDDSQKQVLGTLPYLGIVANVSDLVNFDEKRITTTIKLSYYVYSIICRDLRINSITYSVNGIAYTAVPSFDKDTYTYNIKLPDNTPDNATITTKSVGYMDRLIDSSSALKGMNSGLTIKEANTNLMYGTASVKVENVFDVIGTYGSMIDKTLSSNPTRTYKINFTKYNFLKGDLDRNNVVDANDASIALELYKAEHWTQEDIKYGDMDNNNLIDANDASLILEVYKSNN